MRFIVGGAHAWRLGPGRPPHSPLCVFSIPTPRDMPSWTPETLCGAVDEARALASMYAGGAHLDDDPCDVDDAHEGFLEIAEAALASDEGSLEGVPALEVTVRLLGARLRGGPVAIAVAMPPGYPETTPVDVRIEANARATVADLDALRDAARDAVLDAGRGQASAVAAVEAVRARLADVSAAAEAEEDAAREAAARVAETRASADRRASPDPDALARRLIWFHHIKAPSKRRDAVAWARELRLGGFSKPGYPGVVVVEGRREDCEEYVARLKSLSWKAMSVRLAEDEGEEVGAGGGPEGVAGGGGSEGVAGGGGSEGVGPGRGSRRLPATFEELPENGLGALGEALRAGGLEHLLEAALKQRTFKWTGGVD